MIPFDKLYSMKLSIHPQEKAEYISKVYHGGTGAHECSIRYALMFAANFSSIDASASPTERGFGRREGERCSCRAFELNV